MTRNSVVSSMLVTTVAVVSVVSLGQSLSVAQSTTICPAPTSQTTQIYQGGRTSSYPSGYSAKIFYGIPGYASGLRVKKTGYEDVSATRRNFLVKNNVSATDFQWYADCTTADQVYDGEKYRGDDQDARSLMAYACSLPSTLSTLKEPVKEPAAQPTNPAIRPTR